jgi:hypothetical protein
MAPSAENMKESVCCLVLSLTEFLRNVLIYRRQADFAYLGLLKNKLGLRLSGSFKEHFNAALPEYEARVKTCSPLCPTTFTGLL